MTRKKRSPPGSSSRSTRSIPKPSASFSKAVSRFAGEESSSGTHEQGRRRTAVLPPQRMRRGHPGGGAPGQDRAFAAGQEASYREGWIRSHSSGHPSRPYGPLAEDEALPGPRP